MSICGPTVQDSCTVPKYSYFSIFFSLPEVCDEGTFAKRNIAKGDMIMYYGGNIMADNTSAIIFDNMTIAEKQEKHKNIISLGENKIIHPPDADITKFRATLGHKANHAFGDRANSRYCSAKNPR